MNSTRSEYATGLRAHILNYSARQHTHWQRSYRSLEAYLQSVQPNRLQWQAITRGIAGIETDIRLDVVGTEQSLTKLVLKTQHGLHCEALLARPENARTQPPLVLCLHGIGGTPEMILGNADTAPPSYHAVGRALLDAGFTVLAPRLINNFQERAQINRMALLAGSSVWGLELQILAQLLDLVCSTFGFDEERIAVWGHSMGGAYTLYLMPQLPRIRTGIISAWFNARPQKMVVEDDRYTCFLPSEEEHAFLPGLLTAFSDQDLVSLILPRPLLIQSGKKDNIAWPAFVAKEFESAAHHYRQLQLQDRLQWLLHPGSHEIDVDSGVQFLKKWL